MLQSIPPYRVQLVQWQYGIVIRRMRGPSLPGGPQRRIPRNQLVQSGRANCITCLRPAASGNSHLDKRSYAPSPNCTAQCALSTCQTAGIAFLSNAVLRMNLQPRYITLISSIKPVSFVEPQQHQHLLSSWFCKRNAPSATTSNCPPSYYTHERWRLPHNHHKSGQWNSPSRV